MKKLTDEKKRKLLDFIKKKQPHTFSKWEDEIFFMKDNNAGLKTILEYIFEENSDIKKKYKNRENTALALLSAFIKRYYVPGM